MSDKPLPTIDPDSAPFWAAAGEGRLDLPWCEACGRAHFPPRALCPHCHEARAAWKTAAGTGEGRAAVCSATRTTPSGSHRTRRRLR